MKTYRHKKWRDRPTICIPIDGIERLAIETTPRLKQALFINRIGDCFGNRFYGRHYTACR